MALDLQADPFDAARAEAMIAGYDARWSADEYEVLAVEVEFRAPLTNPETGAASRTFQRGGKMDLIVRECAGQRRTLVGEHKTSGEDIGPGSPYWRKLAMDGQMSGYLIGAKALGFECEGVLYDVLRKPGLKPLKKTAEIKLKKDGTPYANQRLADETPEEYRARCIEAIAADPAGYYLRGDVVRMEAEAAEALWDDWQAAAIMREAARAGRHPRNPDACMKWGRPCTFWDVCTGTASLDDPTRFVRSEHVSPELAPSGGLPILSASRLRAARSCLRLHQLQYLDGYRPTVEPEALAFGSLIHRGLEAWWKATPAERLEAAIAAIRSPAAAVNP